MTFKCICGYRSGTKGRLFSGDVNTKEAPAPRLKRAKRDETRNPFIHSQCYIGSRQAMEHVQIGQWSYYKS